jgi:hypothetical protein
MRLVRTEHASSPAIHRDTQEKDMKLSANIARLVSALVRNPVTALKFAALVAGVALISTHVTAAEGCDPPCPKGQVCAFKDARGGNGATVCKTPITIECHDPLCGLKHTNGPTSLRVK